MLIFVISVCHHQSRWEALGVAEERYRELGICVWWTNARGCTRCTISPSWMPQDTLQLHHAPGLNRIWFSIFACSTFFHHSMALNILQSSLAFAPTFPLPIGITRGLNPQYSLLVGIHFRIRNITSWTVMGESTIAYGLPATLSAGCSLGSVMVVPQYTQLTSNVMLCQRCIRRQRRCAGPCKCTVNGKDIIDNARTGCPLGYYGTAPYLIPDDFDPEQERRRLRQGGCCGSPSKG